MGRAELHPQNSVHEEGHGVEAQGRHIDPTQACKQKGQNRLCSELTEVASGRARLEG